MIGGVTAAAAVRTWPFRVFSFPSEVKIAGPWAVRFTGAFDPIQNKFVTQWFGLHGQEILASDIFKGDLMVEGKTIADVMTHLRSNPAAECYALSELQRMQNEYLKIGYPQRFVRSMKEST